MSLRSPRYLKASRKQRPISAMSIHLLENPMASPYTIENNVRYYEDENSHYASDKKPSKWKNEIYKTVAPDRSREERHDMISTHTCFCDRDAISGGFPWFIISISAWQIGYFFWMYGKADPPIENWNAWNYQFSDNIFIFDPRKAMNMTSPEWWRFYTYCFVHAGWEHLLGNMIMQIMIGITLEYAHGTIRVASLYSIGIVVGSFTALIVTPNSSLVGASGGDFCLMTAVIANVILNSDSMRLSLALIRILFMGSYLAMEVYMSVKRYNENEGNISWAAHLGGAVTGLTLGVFILRNLEKKTWERVATAVLSLIFALYIAGCVGVWILITNPENSIDSAMDLSNVSQITGALNPT